MEVMKMVEKIPESTYGKPPELTYEEAKNLWEVLKRRRYAVLRLKQCMHYIESYFKDFHLSIDFDQSQVNPTLVVRINIMTEIPPNLQNWVLSHVFDITERLTEILDHYSEEVIEKEEERRALEKVLPITGLDSVWKADAFLKSKRVVTG
jgi:hypothetical protein